MIFCNQKSLLLVINMARNLLLSKYIRECIWRLDYSILTPPWKYRQRPFCNKHFCYCFESAFVQNTGENIPTQEFWDNLKTFHLLDYAIINLKGLFNLFNRVSTVFMIKIIFLIIQACDFLVSFQGDSLRSGNLLHFLTHPGLFWSPLGWYHV